MPSMHLDARYLAFHLRWQAEARDGGHIRPVDLRHLGVAELFACRVTDDGLETSKSGDLRRRPGSDIDRST